MKGMGVNNEKKETNVEIKSYVNIVVSKLKLVNGWMIGRNDSVRRLGFP